MQKSIGSIGIGLAAIDLLLCLQLLIEVRDANAGDSNLMTYYIIIIILVMCLYILKLFFLNVMQKKIVKTFEFEVEKNRNEVIKDCRDKKEEAILKIKDFRKDNDYDGLIKFFNQEKAGFGDDVGKYCEHMGFNLLLCNLYNDCRIGGIDCSHHIPNGFINLISNYPIDIDDVTSMLSSIVQNSIDALAMSEEKRIAFTVKEEDGLLIFSVSNNGPRIKKRVQRRMYKKGYSTKGSKRGKGMAFVKSTVEGMGGKVKNESTEKETTFELRFPKC